MKKIIILYHADCSDGFGGAWAAWKKFGNKVSYIPVWHQEPPPKGLKNKIIYMIDFTYPEKITKKLIRDNKRVTSIDHHETAEKTTKLTFDYRFSLDNSGSALAWKYFHPKKKIPLFLKNIEDMDLWKFKVSYTEEIFAYHNLFDFNFKLWDKFAADSENSLKRKKMIEIGRLILNYENRLVNKLVEENVELVKFAGYKVLAVNSPNFHSQIGSLLARKNPPFGIVWREKDGVWNISLRGVDKVHLGELAKRYGGGGHYNSAAFKIPRERPLPWKYLNENKK